MYFLGQKKITQKEKNQNLTCILRNKCDEIMQKWYKGMEMLIKMKETRKK